MTASVISPKPGFDWNLVQWGGPNEPRTEHCSYCGNPLPDDDEDHGFMPLILWNSEGWCAEFCDDCQAQWWGVQRIPEEDDL